MYFKGFLQHIFLAFHKKWRISINFTIFYSFWPHIPINLAYIWYFSSILCLGPPDAPKHWFSNISHCFHMFHLFPPQCSKTYPECMYCKGIFNLYSLIILWNLMNFQKISQNCMSFRNIPLILHMLTSFGYEYSVYIRGFVNILWLGPPDANFPFFIDL